MIGSAFIVAVAGFSANFFTNFLFRCAGKATNGRSIPHETPDSQKFETCLALNPPN